MATQGGWEVGEQGSRGFWLTRNEGAGFVRLQLVGRCLGIAEEWGMRMIFLGKSQVWCVVVIAAAVM